MKTSPVTPRPALRPRPATAPVLFGSFFLWAGTAGILRSATTMGLGPSLTIALLATGIALFIVTLLPRSVRSSPSDKSNRGDNGERTDRLASQDDEVRPDATHPTEFLEETDPLEETDQTDSYARVMLPEETSLMVETTPPSTETSDTNNPWDTDQGWASDIRW